MTARITNALIWGGLTTTAVAIFGAVLVYFVILSNDKAANFPTDGYFFIVNSFLLSAVLLLLLRDYRSVRFKTAVNTKTGDQHSRVLLHLESIDASRTILSKQLIQHYSANISQDSSYLRDASDYLQSLTNELCSLFDDLTGSRCAAAIKLLVPSSSGDPHIRTYVRDHRSSIIRRELYRPESTYPLADHSPFQEITSTRNGGDFFVSNNLSRAERLGEYRNSNRYWRRLYNATIVVPIRDPSALSSEEVVGFLCVDSMTGRFDSDTSVHVMRIVASSIYDVIYALSAIEKSAISDKKSNTTDGTSPYAL